MKIFGFNVTKESEQQSVIASPVKEENADTSVSSHYGVMETGFIYSNKSDTALQKKIKQRWDMYEHSEVMFAVDEVVNEMVDFSESNPFKVDYKKEVPKKLQNEISDVIQDIPKLFSKSLNDIIKNWYVQGGIAFFIQLSKNGKEVSKLINIDPWKLTLKTPSKIQVDPKGFFTYQEQEPYWLYEQEEGGKVNLIKMPFDSIIFMDVGLDKTGSYLDYAQKPLNDLLSLENASVIYRVTRAPEKRAFYVDTGQLAPTKASELVKGLMNRFKSKIDYNTQTGKITTSNKNVIPATVDYWMPRREGSTGTEIDVINETSNSITNVAEEINHFKSKLYQSLFVPRSRVEADSSFNLGNSGTITREEVKFSQLISKLESEFMDGIYHLIGVSLTINNKVTKEEWEEVKPSVKLTFVKNDHFAETKKSELYESRMRLLDSARDYIGEYFSRDFVFKELLNMSEDEIKEMESAIESEKKAGFHKKEDDY